MSRTRPRTPPPLAPGQTSHSRGPARAPHRDPGGSPQLLPRGPGMGSSSRSDPIDERTVLADVVELVVVIGGKHQTHGSGRKVRQIPPDHRMAHRARNTNDSRRSSSCSVPSSRVTSKLPLAAMMNCFLRDVGVAAPGFASWDVVRVVRPPDLEGDIHPALDRRQIALRVRDLLQIDDARWIRHCRGLCQAQRTGSAPRERSGWPSRRGCR